MSTVNYPIQNCAQCPNMKSQRHPTADSFENVHKLLCKAADQKFISYQETFDKPPAIPAWCPLREGA